MCDLPRNNARGTLTRPNNDNSGDPGNPAVYPFLLYIYNEGGDDPFEQYITADESFDFNLWFECGPADPSIPFTLKFYINGILQWQTTIYDNDPDIYGQTTVGPLDDASFHGVGPALLKLEVTVGSSSIEYTFSNFAF